VESPELALAHLRSREDGLTPVELLVTIGILGLFATVIIPNITGFRTAGNLAAANTEVQKVQDCCHLPENYFKCMPFLSGLLSGSCSLDTNTSLAADCASWIRPDWRL
jgi:hypothetical protein